jgi:hypothetical protein
MEGLGPEEITQNSEYYRYVLILTDNYYGSFYENVSGKS